MALLEEVLNGWGGPALLGAGAIMAAPLLISLVGAVVRPAAKVLLQGSLWVVDSVQELASKSSEQLNDLMLEAKAEYHTSVQSR
jgi:Mn2+/Fe2+ NRAMP family transporter